MTSLRISFVCVFFAVWKWAASEEGRCSEEVPRVQVDLREFVGTWYEMESTLLTPEWSKTCKRHNFDLDETDEPIITDHGVTLRVTYEGYPNPSILPMQTRQTAFAKLHIDANGGPDQSTIQFSSFRMLYPDVPKQRSKPLEISILDFKPNEYLVLYNCNDFQVGWFNIHRRVKYAWILARDPSAIEEKTILDLEGKINAVTNDPYPGFAWTWRKSCERNL